MFDLGPLVYYHANLFVFGRFQKLPHRLRIMACVAFGASFMLVRTLMELLQRHVLKIGGCQDML